MLGIAKGCGLTDSVCVHLLHPDMPQQNPQLIRNAIHCHELWRFQSISRRYTAMRLESTRLQLPVQLDKLWL